MVVARTLLERNIEPWQWTDEEGWTEDDNFFSKTDPRRKEPVAQALTEPEEDEENTLQGPPACRILLLKK